MSLRLPALCGLALAAALSTFTSSATAQDGPRPPAAPADAHVLEVPDRPATAHLWTADDGTTWYIASEDGVTFSRPRIANTWVHLRYASFDPLVDNLEIEPALVAHDTQRLHLVQYWTQGLESYRAAIQDLGGETVLYVPQQANVVEMGADSAAAVAALPFVRSVTPFHPAFRLEPELREAIANGVLRPVKVNLLTTRRGPATHNAVRTWLEANQGVVEASSPETYLMTAIVPAPLLPQLAGLDQVQWVDRWTPAETELDMDIARAFHGSNYVETQVGALGNGVRVEVMDGGCETNHPDLQNFLVHSPSNTPSSHGTACSGIVLGSGAGNFSARGVMPNATLMIGDYNSFAGGSRYNHSAELVNPALAYRCVLQSNSWGNATTTAYTSVSQDLDAILFDLENLSILNSQSNTGNQMSRPQAWAKNIISVGGIRHANTQTKNDDSWNFGASIGPAADGRIKPDLASFYDSILCTDRVGSNGYASGNYFSNFGGTSGATPIVAGNLGLFYELWHQGQFGNPTGATVFDSAPKNTTAKAFMIATASQWTFSGSGADLSRYKQGWGHPDLQKMLDNTSEIFWVDETDVLTNLQSTTYNLDVGAGVAELKATLVYRDPPGTTSSSQHRINDLDLRIMSPGGTTYHGNNGLTSGNYSSSGGSPNTVDTVENVFIASPLAGTWQVTVTASSLNQDNHPETGALDADYALVVLGGVLNTGPTIPNAPTSLAAVATGPSTIDVTWLDNSSDEDDFELQRSLTGSGSWSTIATPAANATAFTDTGLNENTTYHYRIRARNTAGNSAWSGTANATTPQSPPAAPSGLSATANGENAIDLAWTDNAVTEDNFEVQRALSGAGPWSTIATPAANATSFGDSGLTANTTYFYRVRAQNSAGNSAWVTASATTNLDPPPAPSGLSATANGENAIDLAWTDNAVTEDNFEVQRALSGAGPWSTIATPAANATSFGDSGLTANTTYFYRVRAQNAAGNSAWVTASATTDLDPPPAPSGLSATANGENAIDLAWTDNAVTEDNFEVQRALSGAGPWSTIATPAANATSFGDSGLTANTTYFYRVRAQNSAGNSAWVTASATTDLDPPPAPSGLSATANGENAIDLAWTDNAVTEDNFEVQRALSGAGPWSTIATPAANATSFGDSGLTANTTYFYRVRAQNAAGNSAWVTASATTDLDPPAAPSGLTATANGENAIDLAWTDNAVTEDNFEVQRALSGAGPWSTIATPAANATSFGDSGLTANTTYFYRVRAQNAAGNSAWVTASATTDLDPPAAPTGLGAVTTGQTTVSLSWTDNATREDSFEVQRGPTGSGPFATIATPAANATTFDDTGLTPDTDYFYRVRAVNSAGNSAWSNVASSTTQEECQPDLGSQGPGSLVASLCGSGLADGETSDYHVTGAQASAAGALLISASGQANVTLFPTANPATLVSGAGLLISVPVVADAGGELTLTVPGQPVVVDLVLQSVFADTTVLPHNLAVANAILAQFGQ